MARQINRLSAKEIAKLDQRGFYNDGDGLYLQVSPSGSKSWVLRYKIAGRTRDMGLGSYNDFTVAEARAAAKKQRQLKHEGLDPIEARNAEREAQAKAKAEKALEAAKDRTFDQCAAEYVRLNGGKWKNPKHRQQWVNTLATYASPVIGGLSVKVIDTPLVLQILEPIWNEKAETASRVRGRIETVLNYAKSVGYRTAQDNPAKWAGHLKFILPEQDGEVEHQPSLPYERAPEFLKHLRSKDGVSAQCLEFTILTASRTGESIGAQWSEVDFEKRIWTVPTERMGKTGRFHRVALSETAIKLLDTLHREADGPYIFPTEKGQPLSDMALNMLVRRMNKEAVAKGAPRYVDPNLNNRAVVPHGFRSTFKVWSVDRSGIADADALSEVALSHTEGDKVMAAYKRTDALERRRLLMEAWAAFCAGTAGGDVVSIDEARRAAR